MMALCDLFSVLWLYHPSRPRGASTRPRMATLRARRGRTSLADPFVIASRRILAENPNSMFPCTLDQQTGPVKSCLDPVECKLLFRAISFFDSWDPCPWLELPVRQGIVQGVQPAPLSGGRVISFNLSLERDDSRHQPFVPHFVDLALEELDIFLDKVCEPALFQ